MVPYYNYRILLFEKMEFSKMLSLQLVAMTIMYIIGLACCSSSYVLRESAGLLWGSHSSISGQSVNS